MFTAEFAVGLMAVVPVTLALLAMVAAGAAQVQVAEAARTAARMVARGDSDTAVREEVASLLPGATLRLEHDVPEQVRVEVSRTVAGWGLLPRFTLHAEVRTISEA